MTTRTRGRVRANLPENARGLRAIDQSDGEPGRCGQVAADLEDKHRVRVALPIQGHRAGRRHI